MKRNFSISLFLAILGVLLLSQIAFAEITRTFDQFANTFTVESKRNINMNDKANLTVNFSKIFSPELRQPIYSLTLIASGNEYFFFSDYFYYLVTGEELGEKVNWLDTDSSSPNKNPVYTIASRGLLPESKLFKVIKDGKVITFRIHFKDKQPFIFYTSEAAIKEWQEVIAFDLKTELEKLNDKK